MSAEDATAALLDALTEVNGDGTKARPACHVERLNRALEAQMLEIVGAEQARRQPTHRGGTMRFKVIERRCYDATYIVEADSAEEAGGLVGSVLQEDHSDCWGDDLLSVEQLTDNNDNTEEV